MNESSPHSPALLWRDPRRWLTAAVAIALICGVLAWVPTQPLPQDVSSHQGHWSSLLPPIIAVVVALVFRSLVAALLSAFCLGAVLRFGLNPLIVVPRAADEFLWANLSGQFSLYIFGFLFSIVGMIHVCYRSGGIQGMVRWITRFATGPRGAQGVTMGAGLMVFFDDYSNTFVVGQTMRSLTDRYRVAREKLAYIVDSTTAPIAGLALISTWIAFEVFLLGETARAAGLEVGGYGLFLAMLPMRFYCLGTLMFVGLNIFSGRDFGPMRKAMERATMSGAVKADDARLLLAETSELEPPEGSPRRGWNALGPLLVVIGGVFGGILLVGSGRLARAGERFSLWSLASWRDAFGITVYDPSLPDGGPGAPLVLFWAAVIGGAVALLLPVVQRILTLREGIRAYLGAVRTLWMAIFILLMAWSMKTICDELGTSFYLVSLVGEGFPTLLLPVLTFLLGAGMAFAMGTSWGTMGVMIPVMLPLAHTLTGGGSEPSLIFLLTAAAVLDGAIFGDHCSPISDTTVLSSMASGCDHLHHVKTQIPYALTTMGLASVTGYIPVAAGWWSPVWFLAIFPALALAVLFGLGKGNVE
jgi:Na+/H+ antiporter NhaC